MVDCLSPEQRVRCMRANKSRGTKPECVMAKELWRRGLHYRRNDRKVLGKPDFCFKGYKVAVFCDGDFWHGRNWEQARQRVAKSGSYWVEKIERNMRRDQHVDLTLRRKGWQVLRFWTNDIMRDVAACADVVEAAVSQSELQRIRRSYVYDTQYDFVVAEPDAPYEP